MQFPESWLREFCNPPIGTQELADVLTMAGLEVEELRPVAPPFSQVVVAQVLEVAKHPNADRLNVCQVDAGTGQTLNIVCGAPNVRPGIKVPCALVGAELPPGEDGKPFRIKLGKLRGVESQGMLCSARELKLSDDHGGLLILEDDAPVGRDLREYLRLDDVLFTLKLTPNLAHCLSVYGVAREVSALTGAPLKQPAFPPVPVSNDARLPVRIEAPDLCGRFSGRVIRNVNPKARTPAWMVERLERCGQRSVSALVDISNYVMFELGRPSHIFDFDKIHGGLIVRWGREGERLKLLNGNTVELDDKVGVIADEKEVESLAGIMGGDATAVSDDTRNIYVEAAFWWPQAVAGRSRRYNFSTEAGHRFERGVDPALTVEHIERISQLVLEICGGEAGPMDDQVVNVPQRQPVTLRVARAAKVIGMPVTQAQCADVFRRLGLEFAEGDGTLTVTPPSWRFDLQIEEDLIEEVIRIIGYQQLPDTAPLGPIQPRVRTESQRGLHLVRRALAALGYQETVNFSFVEERWERDFAGNDHPIRLLNPIASSLSVMRSSLIGSLVQVLKFNLARKASRVRVFEAGRVFLRDDSVADSDTTVAGLRQPLRVCGLAYGPAAPLQWGVEDRLVDFYDVKGELEQLFAPLQPRFVAAEHPAFHPGRCAAIELDGQVVGHVGELHPRWRQAYELAHAPVVFEVDAEALQRRPVPAYRPIPRLQAVTRDLAFIVSERVRHDALIEAVQAAPIGGLVRNVTLFDVYKPKAATADIGLDERSVALRVELLDENVTLTDERIDAAIQAIVDTLVSRLGARLRG
ncbi:phenylalanine--tRNA ligase subunit beta [Caldimonas thermodepolymerans]|uniref:Phenylalanine--tRNA ligase beta subunit n=1 Tax=Caldimonas thermodepolymerans TaxID=215580 RepID=A0AA46HXG6_9BURK|nr:phenylalanine--tRNA ligase subunit beta [Caldimonas thermodepolymerans]TCP09890.1 phenylalanyl-tRNA synthetase beta subunit [Caldimonas thermodepolymerans]UZG46282.1 phenylalanine--tRNA ligase subunit beta [Caldimonas thermodepolymerans]